MNKLNTAPALNAAEIAEVGGGRWVTVISRSGGTTTSDGKTSTSYSYESTMQVWVD